MLGTPHAVEWRFVLQNFIALICMALFSNASFADVYRCEEHLGYVAEYKVLEYDIGQSAATDNAIMIDLSNDWSSFKAIRVMDDLTYEYPGAEAVAVVTDETGPEHHYYSFDTKMSLGHLFVLTYQPDGVLGLKPKDRVGLRTISYAKTATIENYYLCKPVS